MFDTPYTHIGSGLFVCEQILSQQVTITAPYVKPGAPVEPAEQVGGREVDDFVARMKLNHSVFPVQQPVLTEYAAKLIEVSRLIKESAYDIVFCPMRGARMPGLQADLVCQSEPFNPFDGADMAKGINDDRILGELRRLMHDLPAADQRRIGVLDTAIGGDSCRAMARLLRQLNDEAKQPSSVRFHLIYGNDRSPARATEAYSYGTKLFQVEIRYHEVTNLLIEDEPGLLGYDVNRSGGQSNIVRFRQEGQLLVYGHEGATLFRRAPLDETMIALVGREMAKLIQIMPDIKPVNLDYWPYGS